MLLSEDLENAPNELEIQKQSGVYDLITVGKQDLARLREIDGKKS